MEWIIYLFGSGAVFFIGIAFILLALGIAILVGRRWLKIVATLMAIVGLILIVLSATPLPYWLYVVSIGATLSWLVVERLGRPRFTTARNWLRALVAVLWGVCAVLEAPYCMTPTLAASNHPVLYVIGDSVSAGMRDPKRDTWPLMLAAAHPVEVVDLSGMGATAASAMQQADGLSTEEGLVLLEIGGNDLLGSTSAKQFEHDLDALLARICNSKRAVLMFELPLPPFCNEFGRSQRSLAAKYGVSLIPKRKFVAVLGENGATLDSVHLSRQGHEKMAATVWSIVKPAYGE